MRNYKKYSIEDIKRIIFNKPIELISKEYKNAHAHLSWRCVDCGTIWNTSWTNLKHCPSCAYTSLRGAINDDFFEDINTESKAYWLGFLCADGNISGNSVKIMLKFSDNFHLEKFKKDIQSNHKVSLSEKYSRCSFVFRSNKIVRDLKKYGITENKSLTLSPNTSMIQENLLDHFWRGVVDGDGWIDKDGKSISLVGTKKVVVEFKERYGISTKTRQPNPLKNTFTIEANKNLVSKILKSLYEQASVFLDRKYTLARKAF